MIDLLHKSSFSGEYPGGSLSCKESEWELMVASSEKRKKSKVSFQSHKIAFMYWSDWNMPSTVAQKFNLALV